MSIQVSCKKQVLFFILLLIVIFSVLEVILRLYEIQNGSCVFSNKQVFQNIPVGLAKTVCKDNQSMNYAVLENYTHTPNQHYETININAHGFRGPEISKEKPNNVIRIFVIGGSTTFGVGSTSDYTTIPGYLQKRFDDGNFPYQIEVVNAGVPAMHSATEVKLVKEKILEFSPDVLVVYDGWNEAYHDFSIYNETTRNLSPFTKFLKSVNQIYRSSDILYTIRIQYMQQHPEYFKNIFNDKDSLKKSKIWVDRWKDICDIGNEKGFKTIVILQPFLGTGNKTLTSEELKIFKYSVGKNLVSSYENYATTLQSLNDTCTKTADLRNIFDNIEGPLYMDQAHVSDNGNRIVAEEFFKIIQSTVKKIFEEKSS